MADDMEKGYPVIPEDTIRREYYKFGFPREVKEDLENFLEQRNVYLSLKTRDAMIDLI